MPNQLSTSPPDGTVLGHDPADPISFYGAVPHVQQVLPGAAALTDLIQALVNIGLISASGVTPVDADVQRAEYAAQAAEEAAQAAKDEPEDEPEPTPEKAVNPAPPEKAPDKAKTPEKAPDKAKAS